jgi:protein-tyrosine-phosphatase
MLSILFVCTGNRCRSPLAAAIFSNRLREKNLIDAWCVESAGTWTQSGLSADPLAQKAAQEIGLDLQDHCTRSIDQISLDRFDLIVVMEEGHKEALSVEFPDCAGKIHLLTFLADEIEGVPDPAGEDFTFHLETARELVKLIDTAFARICEMTVQ